VPTIQDLLDILQQITPTHLAADWDNVGLLVGNPRQEVHHVLVALDPLEALLDQARDNGCDLIITHHPIIFRPLHSLRTDTPIGGFLARAVRETIGVIACHTNLDAIQNGVSDVLAHLLDMQEARPLIPAEGGCEATCGLGRIGTLPAPLPPEEFLGRLRQACAPPWILEAGGRPQQIHTVAVCGGSCSDLAETALRLGADVFVTAEVKHNIARWAEEAGLWLLDAGHFATEQPAMTVFRDTLRQRFAALGWAVPVDTAQQHPPLRLT
jgi:dinuclear metal center YbgI/SA1388 family protein